jgi:hypothetical protein
MSTEKKPMPPSLGKRKLKELGKAARKSNSGKTSPQSKDLKSLN